jgi:N-acetylmuramoyl-L-alanine amidase
VRYSLLAAAAAAGLTCLVAGAAHASEPTPTPAAVACLAEAVYYEARGKGDRGAIAVAHVVVNRTDDPEFPETVCAVVDDGCEFSYRCDGRPEALSDPKERARAYRAAEAVLAGDAPDPTGGALFFHAASAEPGWFASRDRTGTIGGNVFYR